MLLMGVGAWGGGGGGGGPLGSITHGARGKTIFTDTPHGTRLQVLGSESDS